MLLCVVGVRAQDQSASQVPAQGQAQGQTPNQSPDQGTQNGGAAQPQQPQQPQAPIAAIRSPFAALANGQDTSQGPLPIVADTRPLAGAQYLTLGGAVYGHSFWQPS